MPKAVPGWHRRYTQEHRVCASETYLMQSELGALSYHRAAVVLYKMPSILEYACKHLEGLNGSMSAQGWPERARGCR